MIKKCRECGLVAKSKDDLSLFLKDPSSKHGVKSICTDCNRNYLFNKKYGISLKKYNTMLKEQNGKCKICDTSSAGGRYGRFHVDHCHISGNIRGLLCHNCNRAIGMLNDDIVILSRAILYLTESQQKENC